MSARHLDLLRDLSARNREKEEQTRRDEIRLQKRASSLRERILGKCRGADDHLETLGLAALAEDASPEDRRVYQARLNLEIERRQEEMLKRLQDFKQAEKIRTEREQLKRQWRAHKAKNYLLDTCQNPELREYLESKALKPRALPKLPTAALVTSSVARCISLPVRKAFADQTETAANADLGTPRGRSPKRETSMEETVTTEEAEAEAEETPGKSQISPGAGMSGSAAGGSKTLKPSAAVKASIDNFLGRARLANTSILRSSNFAEWKRRHGCQPNQKVFLCCGGYPDFVEALKSRGWFFNPDKESKHFDLMWGMGPDVHHDSLLPHQVVNHFERGPLSLSSKIGLTLNLRNSVALTGVDSDTFYPRAFDLYDPLERADFVQNFKFTKAESVLREFLRNLRNPQAMTFSTDILKLSLKICLRSVTDVDDVLDCEELAEGLSTVSAAEWAILQQVCLDDVTQKLEGLPDCDMECMIAKRPPPAAEQKEKERVQREEAEKRRAGKGPGAPKAKEKKKKEKQKEEFSFCVPVSEYAGEKGGKIIQQVQDVIKEMEKKNRQHTINGCRNAWIIKPSRKSRGRGIQVVRELEEIFRTTETDGFNWICQKYIEQPQLVHGFKFDIRQWVLVVDWNPLTVYIWRHPYVRFAGQKYDETLADLSEYMHLVNNSIIKKMDGFSVVHEELRTQRFMWFQQQLQAYLHTSFCKCEKHSTPWLKPPPYTCKSFGVRWEDVAFTNKDESDDEEEDEPSSCPACTAPTPSPTQPTTGEKAEASEASREVLERLPEAAPSEGAEVTTSPEGEAEACEDLWESHLLPQIKDIIAWSLVSNADNVIQRKNTYELLGYDFMFSTDGEKPQAWLIEVNKTPACDYSTPVTCPLVKKMMEDTAKIMIDLRENPDGPTGEWELMKHNFDQTVPARPPLGLLQLEVAGKAIKPPTGKKKPKKRASSKASRSDHAGAAQGEEDCDDAPEAADESPASHPASR